MVYGAALTIFMRLCRIENCVHPTGAITITNHLAACCLSEMASSFINDLLALLASLVSWLCKANLCEAFGAEVGFAGRNGSFAAQLAQHHIASQR